MIKFERYPRRVGESIPWSQRRESLAKSKPRRQANKFSKKAPLFSDQLAEEAEKVEVNVKEVKAKRQSNLDRTIQNRRAFQARVWFEARKRFFSCNEETQKLILAKYNGNKYMPKKAIYFSSTVDKYSGEQARRVAHGAKEFEEWKAKNNKSTHTQPTLF